MIQLSKDSNLLKLPEQLYGIIRRIGNLNKEPILYGDVNLLKPGDLYYILGAKQVYRYIKAVSTSNSEDQAEPILPKGLTKGGESEEESELNPDSSVIGPPASEDSSIKTIVYYFDTIRPLSGNMTDGFVIPEEERGHIRNAGYLFNEIIYSGDPNLIENGSLFYHDTLPYISIISNVEGVINLSTKELDEEGEITTVITKYRVNPELYDYSKAYLTLEALESGVFNVVLAADNSSELTSLSYSLDKGNTWITSTNVQEVSGKETYYIIEVTTPTVNNGDKVLWKGDVTYNNTARCYFGGTNIDFNVSGNPFSLFEDDDFKTVTEITDGRLRRLFRDSNVVSAENLSLFATTLANNCYAEMFNGCTSLTTAPTLPATTLTEGCYIDMFRGCTSLTTAPVLPATTLTTYCYENMFYGCTALTTAPVLPANILVQRCYQYMFYNCSKLNYIKAMFTVMLQNATNNWVSGVAAQGTFVKNVNAVWSTTGVNGVPTGWTVETADPEPSDEITI